MKKITTITIALLVGMAMWAGNKVSADLTYLYGQRMMNFEVDWSNLTIAGMSVEEWLLFRQAEQPEYDAVKELEEQCKPRTEKFVKEFNEKLEKVPLFLTSTENCKYTLRVCPLSIDKKGNNVLRCLIIDNDTQLTVADFKVTGKGGHIGSMGNLWGDGFGDAGEKFGDVVKKAIKK